VCSGVGFDGSGLRACGVTAAGAVAGRLDRRDVCIVHSAFDDSGVVFDGSGL